MSRQLSHGTDEKLESQRKTHTHSQTYTQRDTHLTAEGSVENKRWDLGLAIPSFFQIWICVVPKLHKRSQTHMAQWFKVYNITEIRPACLTWFSDIGTWWKFGYYSTIIRHKGKPELGRTFSKPTSYQWCLTHTHTCIQACICTHWCTCTHTEAHVCAHAHMYAWLCLCSCVLLGWSSLNT